MRARGGLDAEDVAAQFHGPTSTLEPVFMPWDDRLSVHGAVKSWGIWVNLDPGPAVCRVSAQPGEMEPLPGSAIRSWSPGRILLSWISWTCHPCGGALGEAEICLVGWWGGGVSIDAGNGG